ncbi:hypothetical protein MOB49_21455, partial [Bacillus haynesii]
IAAVVSGIARGRPGSLQMHVIGHFRGKRDAAGSWPACRLTAASRPEGRLPNKLLQGIREEVYLEERWESMESIKKYTGYSYEEKLNIIADTLNHCKMLFELVVFKQDRKIVLSIQTEKVYIEYHETSKASMKRTLKRLKEKVRYPEDIDELLLELANLARVPMKSTLLKRDRVLKMYHDEKKSITQIARELKMDFQTVKKILIEHSSQQPLRTFSETQRVQFEKLTESGIIEKMKRGRKEKLKDPNYIEKLSKTKEGTLNPNSKLTEADVKHIRKLYVDLQREGHMKSESQKIIARKYGVKRPTISDIVLKRTWKHVE